METFPIPLNQIGRHTLVMSAATFKLLCSPSFGAAAANSWGLADSLAAVKERHSLEEQGVLWEPQSEDRNTMDKH